MRRFLSILLVVLLLLSILAVPASAMSAGAVATAVDGLAAVSAIISGSGVTIAALEQFDAWNNLVTAASSYLTEKNIIDAAGTILALKNGQKLYFPSSVVQSVKDWLFSSNSINHYYPFLCSNTVISPATGESFTFSSSSPIYIYYFSGLNYNGGLFFDALVISESTLYYDGSSLNKNYSIYGVVNPNGTQADLPYTYVGQSPRFFNFTSNFAKNWGISYTSPSSIDGLSSSDVFPIDSISLSENYPVWVNSSITYPPITTGGTEEDEPIVYLPVSVPAYSTAVPSLPLSQTDVWTGKDLSASDTDSEDEEQVIPIAPDLSQPVNSILELIIQIAADILAIKNAVVTWFTETWVAFTTWLTEMLTAIKELIAAIPGLIVAAIEALAATVTSIWEWLKEVLGLTLQQILEALTAIKAWALGLVDALIAALSALLTKLFGVDIAAVQAAVAELRAEFPFFDSIIATGEFLYNGISSGEPPVIYAHLENAEGALNWGGTVAVLDMSFYARYKSTGDAIISAALYAFFGWRTFVRLPGIISGAGSDIKEVTNHYDI